MFAMKVLITGAEGQVGRVLQHSAPALVRVIGCSHKELNIADESAVARCIRQHEPEVIINAAAYTLTDRAESEPELARAANTDGPRHLAVAARGCGARLVHISTDYVFDGTASVPYKPNAPTNPLNVYGVTKRDGENVVLDVLSHRSVILRTGWVYAARGHNFLTTMLQAMQAKGSVRVVTDHIGTPTAARSLADTIWSIVARPQIRGIHHWSDAGVASWYDFAVAIAEEAADRGLLSSEAVVIPIATQEYPTAARRPQYSVLDKSSLIHLGWMPIHWRKQLRGVIEEIRNA
jgi:dTDP-4-dehydrorhamnose reductase